MPLHTEVFHSVLHTEAFTRPSFYTQKLWRIKLLHTNAFTHRILYMQKLLHTETFTHRRFYAQKLVLYSQKLLHTNAFTERSLYTEQFLRTEKGYEPCGSTWLRTMAWLNFFCADCSGYCFYMDRGVESNAGGPFKLKIKTKRPNSCSCNCTGPTPRLAKARGEPRKLGSTFREMPAFVRKIRITLQISPLSGSFTIFHLFPAFAERNSKLDFTSEGIQPCSGSGRHASWPRPCCKIRRHGLWIKLRPHRLCYGLSPIAMRAIVAPLKMGLRRITYLVSAKDQTNFNSTCKFDPFLDLPRLWTYWP